MPQKHLGRVLQAKGAAAGEIPSRGSGPRNSYPSTRTPQGERAAVWTKKLPAGKVYRHHRRKLPGRGPRRSKTAERFLTDSAHGYQSKTKHRPLLVDKQRLATSAVNVKEALGKVTEKR